MVKIIISNEIIKQFMMLPTGNICDVSDKGTNMDSELKPISSKFKLAGQSTTVKCYPGDNLTIHKAIYEAEPGSVLVITTQGYSKAGYFGEILATACMERGLAGVIIDGGCRDANDIESLGFPVFCRALNPGGTVKESVGEINVPIECGGVIVNPGDIVIGDRDGIVVVDINKAEDVLKKAQAKFKSEIEIKKQLLEGKTTLELFKFHKLCDENYK